MSTYTSEILRIPASDLERVTGGRARVLPDTQSLHRHFAESIADVIRTNNAANRPTKLILPVGPTAQYPILAKICNENHISWKNTYTFNMDEYLDLQGRPVPQEHPMSFRGFMRDSLFNLLDAALRIPEDHAWFPDPFTPDDISRKIKDVGGIDVCYGGIGYHGHIAFNEPPNTRWYCISPEQFRHSKTRVVPLAPDTMVVNSMAGAGGYSPGGNSAEVPPMAVTLGMADILSAKRIRLYCDGGDWQRTIFRIAILGDESVEYPVTLIHSHSDWVVHADLRTATHPRSTARTEPKA